MAEAEASGSAEADSERSRLADPPDGCGLTLFQEPFRANLPRYARQGGRAGYDDTDASVSATSTPMYSHWPSECSDSRHARTTVPKMALVPRRNSEPSAPHPRMAFADSGKVRRRYSESKVRSWRFDADADVLLDLFHVPAHRKARRWSDPAAHTAFRGDAEAWQTPSTDKRLSRTSRTGSGDRESRHSSGAGSCSYQGDRSKSPLLSESSGMPSTPRQAAEARSPQAELKASPKRNSNTMLSKGSPKPLDLMVIMARIRLFRLDPYSMSTESEDFRCFRRALLQSPFCTAMNDMEAAELARHVELFRFSAGKDVVRKGELGTHFFVVRDGSFSAQTAGDSRDVSSASSSVKLRAGDSFGEVALLHGCKQWQTVTAKAHGGFCWGVAREAFIGAIMPLVQRTFQENLSLLGQIRMFQYLDRQERMAVCKSLVVQVYDRGMNVTFEGLKNKGYIFIVKSGTLEVTIRGHRITVYRAGDVFGERALLYNECRSATISTLEPAVVLAMTRQMLRQVLADDFEDVMWRNIIFIALRDLRTAGRLPFDEALDLEVAADAFTIENFPGYSNIIKDETAARGLRFIIALDGDVVVRGPGDTTGLRLTRGECFGLEYLADVSLPFQHSVENSSASVCKLSFLSADAVAALRAYGQGKEVLTRKQKMELIRRVYVFRHLSNHHCNLLVNSFRTIKRKQGEKVIEEGELGSQFFVITSGELSVTIQGRSIRTLGKSDYFGERGLLYNEPRTATVTCQSAEAELMVIDKGVFLHIVEEKMLQHLEERIRLQKKDIAFADLRVVKILGRGTFGVVKLVQDTVNGTKYAMKCVGRKEAERDKRQGPLLLEREILLENDHPFIVKVVSTYKDEQYLYFLMELVTGGELYDIIRTLGLLSKQQAQFYTGSMILALESLHERSIVFRDLKPENVLVDSQGFIKLIDFGCAMKLRREAPSESCPEPLAPRCFTIVGTPHYVAPEVILGTGYGLTCDVWSLGICLYEFVCGPLPFGNKTDEPDEVFREILSAKLRIPDALDRLTAQILRQLLRRSHDARLGCDSHGWRAVRGHDYFSGFSFDTLLSRQLVPPLVPDCEDLLSEHDEAGSQANEQSDGSASGGGFSDVSEVSQSDGGLSDVSDDLWKKHRGVPGGHEAGSAATDQEKAWDNF